ncbi:hypothetical protein DB347_07285 [Opitutaceae bacterium EW11]|nr:hypothetical protein DB347_07285 [Opitutaceae bacterium EW11]
MRRLVFLSLAGVLLAFSIWAYLSVPLRRPASFIRAELLRATPPGCGVSEIERYIGPASMARAKRTLDTSARVRGLEVQLGTYSFPRQTEVKGVWILGEDGRLTDVKIEKITP